MIPAEVVRAVRCGRRCGAALGVVFLLLAPARAQLPPPTPEAPPPPPASVGTPTVAVSVRVPAESPAGKEVAYEVFAENTSAADAHHVVVKATVSASGRVVRSNPLAEQPPAEAGAADRPTVLTWRLGTLRPGEKQKRAFAVLPQGGGEVRCCARVQFEHGQCVVTRIGKAAPGAAAPAAAARGGVGEGVDRQPAARPALRLQTIAPRAMALHEAIIYTFRVSNVGQAAARKVVLQVTPANDLAYSTSKPPAAGETPLTWDLGDVPPGAVRAVECHLLSLRAGRFAVQAVVKAADGLTEKDDRPILIEEPKLSVRVSGPAHRTVGREGTYRITVRNVGDATSPDVELDDEEAKGTPKEAVIRARPTGGGRVENNVTRWNLGPIPPGGEKTVAVALRASKWAGTYKYTCAARVKTKLMEFGTAEIQFAEPSGLILELDRIAPSAQVKLGGEVSYTLRIRGTARLTSNVDVVVTIPGGLRLVKLEGPPLPALPPGPTVRLPTIVRLEEGKDNIARLRFQAVKEGAHRLQAKAVSDATGPDKPVTVEDPVTVEK